MADQLFYPEYTKERFGSPEPGSDDFFRTLGVLVERTPREGISETNTFMSVEEARRLFNETVNERDVQRLQVRTREEAFKMLLLNENGELTDTKIKNIYQNFLPLQNAKMEILGERPVSSVGEYYGTLMDFVGRKNRFTREDVGRCIGVDVDYLSTMDFDMEPADMEFLMKAVGQHQPGNRTVGQFGWLMYDRLWDSTRQVVRQPQRSKKAVRQFCGLSYDRLFSNPRSLISYAIYLVGGEFQLSGQVVPIGTGSINDFVKVFGYVT
uniref:Uncharacterized protein n=1 Tax=Branchiostoma floridae TaxID=7739 RepID=C4A0H8_BRAFL|eukprot:XP_002585689.1 hypothetical protein BRAFLDRAFT_111441 [Branchiostoma floridae]